MSGLRHATIHLALVALLLRAFLPAGWMPGGPGEAPLVMCSVGTVHDTDGKQPPAKPDTSTPCAFAAAPGLAAPEILIAFTPMLAVYAPSSEQPRTITSALRAHERPAPRAPPALI